MTERIKDVVPELLEIIEKEFAEEIANDKILNEFIRAINDGADYRAVHGAAIEIGEKLAEVLRRNITTDILPDGKMYYNIAERILKPTLKRNYEMITGISEVAQKGLNKTAGIGIKPIKPKLNHSKIDGLINKVTSYDDYEKARWVMGEPIVNFTQCVVDDYVEANAEFHAKSGIRATIERVALGGCCEYCSKLEGTHTYPYVDKKVFSRHRDCRCMVTYSPGDGRKQNVWNKKWKDPEESDKIERRKKVGESKDRPIKQLKNKAAEYASMDREEVYKAAKEGKRHKGTYVDAMNKPKKRLEKTINSHVRQIEIHNEKISNPTNYDQHWNDRPQRERDGLIKKWKKEINRNAEQAEIGIKVWEERFDE